MDSTDSRLSPCSLWLVATTSELARLALVDHMIIRANRMAATLVDSPHSPRVIVNESGHVVYANDIFLRFFQAVTIEKVIHLRVHVGRSMPDRLKLPAELSRGPHGRRGAAMWAGKSRPDLLALRSQDVWSTLEFACSACCECRRFAVCSMPLRMSDRTFALLQLDAQTQPAGALPASSSATSPAPGRALP